AGRPLTATIAATLGELLHDLPQESLLAIDIPIGLADRGARRCDVEARRCLGPGRGSSVFPAPTAWRGRCRRVPSMTDADSRCRSWCKPRRRADSQPAHSSCSSTRASDDACFITLVSVA